VVRGRSRLVRGARVEDDGRVVAFAAFGPPAQAESARAGEIHALYAHPDAWGTGAGRALMAAVLDDLRSSGCAEAVDAGALSARAVTGASPGPGRLGPAEAHAAASTPR
jgi:GNAT superfamily N-acetyltransferase